MKVHFYRESTIRIKINNVTTAALIDTGATASVCKYASLKQIIPNVDKMIRKDIQRTFTAASNDVLKPKGTIMLTFRIGNETFTTLFHVLYNLSQDFILGVDFLKKHQAKLDLNDSEMQLSVNPIVKPVRKCRLAPGEAKLITATVAGGQNILLPHGLNGEIQCKAKMNGLVIEPTLCTVARGKMKMLVTNISSFPRVITPTNTQTRFHPLSLEDDELVDPSGKMQQSHLYGSNDHKQKKVNSIGAADIHERGYTEREPTLCNDTLPNIDDLPAKMQWPISDKIHEEPSEKTQTDKIYDRYGCAWLKEEIDAFTNKNDIVTNPETTHVTFDISKTSLKGNEKEKLRSVLRKNKDAFIDSTGKLGLNTEFTHKIYLKPDATPKAIRPYRLPPNQIDEVEKMLAELQENGVIEPSESPWSSPMFVVTKGKRKSHKHMKENKKPELRLLIDFRYLNSQVETLRVTLPLIPEIIDAVGRAKATKFAILDIRSGYFQQNLHPDSRYLTAFHGPRGTSYAFKRVPQGFTSSPFLFQKMVSQILRPYLGKCAEVFIDDIILYAQNTEGILQALDGVLAAMTHANLKLHAAKSQLVMEEVEYLGLKFSAQGVKMSDKHTEAIRTFPTPKKLKDVRVWLGLINFFSNMIPNRAKLCKPLTALTKKNVKFHWSEKCQNSFLDLKEILTNEPVLAFPNYAEHFYLMTDGSLNGAGAVLAQTDPKSGKLRPISYYSRSLNKHELNYTVSEIELLAVMVSVKHFHCYLIGKQFTLITDHQALVPMLKSDKKLSGRLARWTHTLNMYDMIVKYKPGKWNLAADALSRGIVQHNDSSTQDAYEDPIDIPNMASLNRVSTRRDTKQEREMEYHIQKEADTLFGDIPVSKRKELFPQIDLNDTTWQQEQSKEGTQKYDNTDNIHNDLDETDTVRNDNDDNVDIEDDAAEKLTIETQNAGLLDEEQLIHEDYFKLDDNDNDDNDDNSANKWSDIDKQTEPHAKHEPLHHKPTRQRKKRQSWPEIKQIWQDTSAQGFTKDTIREQQKLDPFTSDLRLYLDKGILPPTARRQRITMMREFSMFLDDGILYHLQNAGPKSSDGLQVTLCIPKTLQVTAIKMLHTLHGHIGIQKTVNLGRQKYCFPGMYALTKRLIVSCEDCQKANASGHLLQSPRHLYEMAPRVFGRIHIDMLGKFTLSERNMLYLIVIVDSTSNFVVAIPVRNITTETVVRALHTHFFSVFGIPQKIVSDNGSQFLSALWKQIGKLYNIKMSRISPYNSRANGKVEQKHRTLTAALKGLVRTNNRKWCTAVFSAVMAINATVASPHGYSPYQVVFGRSCTLPIDLSEATFEDEKQPLHEIIKDQLLFQAKAEETAIELQAAKAKQLKEDFDKNVNCKSKALVPGQVVYWKRKTLDDKSRNLKLQDIFRGPYMVLSVSPKGAAILKNLADGKLLKHPVNITQLKVPSFFQGLENNAANNTGCPPVNQTMYAPQTEYSPLPEN